MKLAKIHSLVMKAPHGTMTLRRFLSPIRKAFKPYSWIRIEQTALNSPGETFSDAVCVAGRFDPNYFDRPGCRERAICFVTVSGYSNKSNDGIRFEGARRERILFDIFATIAHERIHLLQSRKSYGCPRLYRHHDSSIRYYGSKIEIDAYAFTSALEEHHGFVSDILKKYRELFKPDDPHFKRFLKKKWQYSLTLPPLCDINRP